MDADFRQRLNSMTNDDRHIRSAGADAVTDLLGELAPHQVMTLAYALVSLRLTESDGVCQEAQLNALDALAEWQAAIACATPPDSKPHYHRFVQPPKELDGARVLAVADLGGVRATGALLLYNDDGFQDSNDFAYLALAEYDEPGAPGCYVFYCDAQWVVQNDMLYESREDAEDMVQREFEGLRFVNV